MAEDTFWLDAPAENGGGPIPDLVLAFEGDLHSVLWVHSFGEHSKEYSSQLRRQFDRIVKKHGLFFNFKDEVTGHFYSKE